MRKTHLGPGSILAALLAMAGAGHAAPPPGLVTFTARLADGTGPLAGSHNFTFTVFAAPTGGSSLWNETHNNVPLDDGLVSVALGSTTPLTTTIFDGSERYLEVTIDGGALDERVPLRSVPYALRAGVASTAEALTATAQATLDAKYAPKGATTTCNAGTSVIGIDAQGSVMCAAYQSPLSAGCAAGQYLRSFAADGTASCFSDGKGVAALNGGLQGASAGDNVALSIMDDAITSARILDGAVTSADIANGTIASIDILDGTIGGGDLAADSIGASHLVANSVSSSEIVDASITAAEMAANACTTTQILDGTIALADMGADAVNSLTIVNNTVGYDDVSLPMFTSVVGGSAVTLVSGNNDLFAPQTFVATTTGSCMVTAQARLTNAGNQASGQASLRVLVRVVGGTAVQDASAAPIAGAYSPTGNFPLTKTQVVSVNAATTVEFGCRVNASGDYIGDSTECQVTVLCQ